MKKKKCIMGNPADCPYPVEALAESDEAICTACGLCLNEVEA